MRQHHPKCSAAISYLLGATLLCSSSSALGSEEADQAALYNVAVQTSMPHLEENLRYTKTTWTTCLTRSALLVAFPALRENAFNECRLAKQDSSENEASYRLVCPLSSGTTGIAKWRFDASHLAGSLEVKLGGKNMTFHQRVTAKRVGACTAHQNINTKVAPPSMDRTCRTRPRMPNISWRTTVNPIP